MISKSIRNGKPVEVVFKYYVPVCYWCQIAEARNSDKWFTHDEAFDSGNKDR